MIWRCGDTKHRATLSEWTESARWLGLRSAVFSVTHGVDTNPSVKSGDQRSAKKEKIEMGKTCENLHRI